MIMKLSSVNDLKLELLHGGYSTLDRRWVCDERSFPFTRLYYIYRGSGVLSCNGETITMTPGNLYLLPANLPVAYHCPEYMEQLFLHVTMRIPGSFDMLSEIPRICQLPCSEALLRQLNVLANAEDYGQLLKFKTIISQNIADCLLAENIPFPIKPYSHEILQVMTYLQNNLSVQLSGEQIAHAVGISPSSLYKRFKAETGYSLGAYQDKLIFYRATQLLAQRQLSIKEISQQLGFCDQYYFSRRFKSQIGKTPSQYRKYHLAH